jgi:hypothetical protein
VQRHLQVIESGYQDRYSALLSHVGVGIDSMTMSAEFQEQRLAHREAENFYRGVAAAGRKVRVGMEANGSDRGSGPETDYERASVGKEQNIHSSEMALFFERMLEFARKPLDIADIVREAIFRQERYARRSALSAWRTVSELIDRCRRWSNSASE